MCCEVKCNRSFYHVIMLFAYKTYLELSCIR